MFRRAPYVPEGFDPAEYGLGVRKMPPVTDRELAEFYLKTKENTGLVIPELERYLGALAVPVDRHDVVQADQTSQN